MLSAYRTPRSGQRGSVLAELALIAPVILFVAGWCARVTQLLQAQQIASVISRELATEAFRFCADISISQTVQDINGNENVVVDQAQTGPMIQQCLAAAQNRFLARWNQLAPAGAVGAPTLNVVAYRYDFGAFSSAAGGACNQQVTRIDAVAGSSVGLTGQNDPPLATVCARGRMVRVELIFNVQPIFAFVGLFPAPGGPNLLANIQMQDVTEI
jgi:hypothetical protein